MRWSSKPRDPLPGDRHDQIVFCLMPKRCDTGQTVWLEKARERWCWQYSPEEGYRWVLEWRKPLTGYIQHVLS